MPRFYTNLESDNPAEGIFRKLYEWEAPERQWFPKTRAWYVVYAFFFIFIIFIAALLQEYIFIVAIISFSFLWFIQGSIAPQTTLHIITSIGIRAFDQLYKWNDITHFWFSYKGDTLFLNLDIISEDTPNFNRRIPLIIKKGEDQKIFDLLLPYIDYGDKKEISFNIFTQFINGKYLEISNYMVEEDEDEMNMRKLNELSSSK